MRRWWTVAITVVVLVACTSSPEPPGPAVNLLLHGEPTAPPATPVRPSCRPDPGVVAPPPTAIPSDLASTVQGRLGDPRLHANRFSVSIWVDGLGEVATHEPDLALFPASNQKLLTAMGALDVLGADRQLVTRVVRGPGDDLVIIGGGDPSLTTFGPHSLDALAAAVRAAGVTTVGGALVVDETRHDGLRRAAGWQDWQVPAYAGPLSALMVDRNRYRSDAGFLADPATANAERFRAALAAHGVVIAGPTVVGRAPRPATPIATLRSAPVGELVRDLLLVSDNMAAETLVKEIGRVAGNGASTAGGLAATRRALSPLCVPLIGADDDGSGLSRANGRSAREWRMLLQAARTASWFPLLLESLPTAGRTGTLTGRFHGTPAEGVVHAKTGTIIGGVALSGYGTTAGGRAFVFSIVVNGGAAGAALPAVDALVATVAGYAG